MTHSIPLVQPKITNIIVKLAVPYMFLGGALMIVFFLILKLFGMQTMTDLRWLNLIFMIPIIILVSKKYITAFHGKTYLESFALNFLTFLGSYIVLSVFMFLYLSFIDPAMMNLIRVTALPELQLTPLNIVVLMIGEAIIAGLIISFAATQYFQYRIRKMA